jgi:hypothetical protein
MSAYINTKTLEYPLHEGDIRLIHEDIPEELTGSTFPKIEGFAKVTLLPEPTYNPETHLALALPPQCINGKWYVDWSDPTPYTQAELEARTLLIAKHTSPVEGLNASGEVPNVIG